MKTILEINSTNYASTGNIMLNIASEAGKSGYNVYTACKASKESNKHISSNQIIIGLRLERIISSLINDLTGLRDHCNIVGTYLFIRKIKEIKPDLIHMHTMHDDFINTKMFFSFLSSLDIPIIWTFHDCATMTGKCPYFDICKCEKWKTGCHHCPQLHADTNSVFFDTTKRIWSERRKYFTSLKNLTIVTPSKWLANLVKESYFSKYDVKVLNNGIDFNIFKPTQSDFRNKYNLDDKFIILGIANMWRYRKGLDVFIELANRLDDKYQIVLVGTNDEVDIKLPSNIISIHRTYNQKELVNIYSAADIFVNPTREENFPTVNIEALACGTPVITFNTGGSPEILDDKCGMVVEKDDIEKLIENIDKISKNTIFNSKDCVNRSKLYDMGDKFKDYINLYNKLLK